jgi:hypothetical protein
MGCYTSLQEVDVFLLITYIFKKFLYFFLCKFTKSGTRIYTLKKPVTDPYSSSIYFHGDSQHVERWRPLNDGISQT